MIGRSDGVVVGVGDFEIGEILAERQDLVLQQCARAIIVAHHIVAVGSLRAIDVPARRIVAVGDDAVHLDQRGRHDRAAGLGGAEECLLVHLLRFVGVADEDDLDALIAPREKHVQQHEEALGEILHMLGHRAGDVHQAEHHRLRDGLGKALEAAIAQIDGIEERNAQTPLARSVAVLRRSSSAPLRFRWRPRDLPLEPFDRHRARGRPMAMRRASDICIVRPSERLAGVPLVV